MNALLFDDVAVFVQHTSTKPITWELAQEMAMSLISSNSRHKAAGKPRSTP